MGKWLILFLVNIQKQFVKRKYFCKLFFNKLKGLPENPPELTYVRNLLKHITSRQFLAVAFLLISNFIDIWRSFPEGVIVLGIGLSMSFHLNLIQILSRFFKYLLKTSTYLNFIRIRQGREVSPSSYLGQTQGLAGNSKSTYEVCWS